MTRGSLRILSLHSLVEGSTEWKSSCLGLVARCTTWSLALACHDRLSVHSLVCSRVRRGWSGGSAWRYFLMRLFSLCVDMASKRTAASNSTWPISVPATTLPFPSVLKIDHRGSLRKRPCRLIMLANAPVAVLFGGLGTIARDLSRSRFSRRNSEPGWRLWALRSWSPLCLTLLMPLSLCSFCIFSLLYFSSSFWTASEILAWWRAVSQWG